VLSEHDRERVARSLADPRDSDSMPTPYDLTDRSRTRTEIIDLAGDGVHQDLVDCLAFLARGDVGHVAVGLRGAAHRAAQYAVSAAIPDSSGRSLEAITHRP
jgi:hypothetical protein